MVKIGRPPKGTDSEIIERIRPWERYGVCRASWYKWRHVLQVGDSGAPIAGHLEVMRIKKLRKKNREEAKMLESELESLKT